MEVRPSIISPGKIQFIDTGCIYRLNPNVKVNLVSLINDMIGEIVDCVLLDHLREFQDQHLTLLSTWVQYLAWFALFWQVGTEPWDKEEPT